MHNDHVRQKSETDSPVSSGGFPIMESPSQELLTPEGGKPQKPRPQDLLSVKEEPRHYKISVGIAMNELDKKYSHEVRVDLATQI